MVGFSVEHPRFVTVAMVVVTLLLAAFMPKVIVDTDPENMLSSDDPARVFHDQMKDEFSVHDMIVVGIVNEEHEDGVFNPDSLRKIHTLTRFAEMLRGDGLEPGVAMRKLAQQSAAAAAPEPADTDAGAPSLPTGIGGGEEPALPSFDEDAPALPSFGEPGDSAEPPLPGMGEDQEEQAPEPPSEPEEDAEKGVVIIDLMAPSTVDRIEHRPPSTVEFSYLMEEPLPQTREACLAVRDGALANPLLKGTVVSEDGRAVAIYLPITHKDISYKVSQRLQEMTAELGGPEQYYITGLPVAEDTFGHEMFVQMAISAPMAMLVIFLLLMLFFRKLLLILSPMIVAMVSVIITMGLLIGLGYTVHIMSSMIPIFIMPIAVLDAIHILSEFFDRYQATRDRKATILKVMEELFMPMLYTSLTSAAGFASLALTPIPPVQVFGMFVAFGIMLAWVLTVTFIPAYIMFIPESRLAGFGVSHAEEAPSSPLTRLLHAIGAFTHRRSKLILTGALLVVAVAAYGISRIQINDNPTKWFTRNHPIRIADRELNKHFAGTYQAYLALTPEVGGQNVADIAAAVQERIDAAARKYADDYPDEPAEGAFREAQSIVEDHAAKQGKAEAFLAAAIASMTDARRQASGSDRFAWDDVIAAVEAEQLQLEEPLKQPELLRYIEDLQAALVRPQADGSEPVVGKSSSVVDIVKKVHRELKGDDAYYAVPDDPNTVAECLFQFGSSHTPDDLYHFVTPDYKKANLWLQLRSGDNRDMERVLAQVDRYFQENPPPVAMEHRWFGLTYINVAWQQKMVSGMLQAFMGSFIVVFILMTVLFHSVLWGLLSMIPLTITIAVIYGLIGLVGKDYDMPVAVLSSLTLGLAVDFAIHFLARSRNAVREAGSWDAAAEGVFGEPARAISRNAIVVAVGFLPLLLAPLTPYKTVGVFMAAILGLAAVATLLLLPALVNVLKGRLFADMGVRRITCNCVACFVASLATVVLLALSFHQFGLGWDKLTWISVILVPLSVMICGIMCRRRACRLLAEHRPDTEESKGE